MADYKVLFKAGNGEIKSVVVSTENGFGAAAEQVKKEYFHYNPNVIAIELVENPNKEWDERKEMVRLTNKQWSNLACYLLMTTKYREGELNTWKSLAEELEEDGVTRKFPNAEKNIYFWQEMIEFINFAIASIDKRM